jgi:hypothetical protein
VTEWRDAEEVAVPVPDDVPDWRRTVTTRTGLWIELQWGGQRERSELLEIRDLPDGRRALLTIVNVRRPGIRIAWIYWNPDTMSLFNRWHRGALSAAETDWQEGDAHRIGVGEMSDCFEDCDWTTFRPHLDVEVRAGGRWHQGKLLWRYNGATRGRAVWTVDVGFHEPEWGAVATYQRMYRWDPQAMRAL